MKKVVFGILVILAVMSLGSCARARAQGDFAGSTFGMTSKAGDWIIISQSGGKIMDVWLVKDTIVASAESSDGWIFSDANGTPTSIGGDVKTLRVKNPDMFNKYHEYHMEFESKSYRELYTQ